jgi:predicted DNA-binding transcriptional regulator AlpA
MSTNFDALGRAVDSGRLQTALGLSRAHLHKLVTKTYDIGMGAALPRPVGVLGGSMVWDVRDLQKALPAFLSAREAAETRLYERIEREPVDFDELAKRREDFEGLPHVLGLMDAALIAEAFDLGENGARLPGEWALRGKLLSAHKGVIGTRRVWDVREVKEHEPLIRRHLERRKSLAESA